MHKGSLREMAPLSIVILSRVQINRLSAHYGHLGPALSGMMDWGSMVRDTGTLGVGGPQTHLIIIMIVLNTSL